MAYPQSSNSLLFKTSPKKEDQAVKMVNSIGSGSLGREKDELQLGGRGEGRLAEGLWV